jgi:hypothetical protein
LSRFKLQDAHSVLNNQVRSLAELIGFQASACGSEVRVRLAGGRVHLGGQPVSVLRGESV